MWCRYTDRIEIEWGKPVRYVTAHPINKKYSDREYDFYKEDADGNAFCRNLYTCPMGGYSVQIPGVRVNSSYYGNYEAHEEEWTALDHKIKCFPGSKLTETYKNCLTWAFPDFRYVMNKWKANTRLTMEALAIWQKHPEIELLLAGKFENIALNKSFWRMSEKKRKEVCLFLRHNKYKDYTLNEVQQRIKYKLTDKQWKEFQKWNDDHPGSAVGYELYKYLSKQEEKYLAAGLNPNDLHWIKQEYTDYKNSFRDEACLHSFKDFYWKYPKDLYEAHTRLNAEITVQKILLEKKKHQEIEKNLKKVINKYKCYNQEVDGYSVFVTSNMEDWIKQAQALHQCIVASLYYEKVARKECLIVFIRKGSTPIATAQISILDKTWKIGQFYANELDRRNCLPSDEVRTVFNKWLATVPAKEAI